MKNIYIEGIQGMGKSTLLQQIATRFPEYHVCREGDYSPVELAWCARLTEPEYQEKLNRYSEIQAEIEKHTVQEVYGGETFYIVCYTKILTDIPRFHKELEQYEIYNGRKTLQKMQEIILARYHRFCEIKGNGYLFECAFLQNIVEDLILFHQLSDDEIVDFYRRLYATVDKDNFLLLYLYSDEIEETTKVIRKERSDAQGNEMWYPLMLEYLTNSPYGKAHGYKEFEDMVEHFRHRQQVELRILKEIVGKHAVILPAKKWSPEFITKICD